MFVIDLFLVNIKGDLKLKTQKYILYTFSTKSVFFLSQINNKVSHELNILII